MSGDQVADTESTEEEDGFDSFEQEEQEMGAWAARGWITLDEAADIPQEKIDAVKELIASRRIKARDSDEEQS